MNEVKMTPVASPMMVSQPTSSREGEVNNAVQEIGKILPPTSALEKQPAGTESVSQPTSPAELEKAVLALNDYVQSINRELQFSVDEDTERTVIKVVDTESGELIRQIPDQVFLELARKLNDDGQIQLIDALG